MLDILNLASNVIDKLFPDKSEAAAQKVKLVELQQSGELKDLEMFLEDVKSAREREIAVKDSMPAILSLLSLALFAFTIYALFSNMISHDTSEVAYMLLGTVTSLVTTVFGYYFGTTRGSNLKTTMMVDMQKAVDYRKKDV